jgi:NADPH-dependent 7-cyano-7-deazaguanine reductase QueF
MGAFAKLKHLKRRWKQCSHNIFDPATVEAEATKVIEVLQPDFWAVGTEWTAKGLDTQADRKILMDALEQIVRNARQKVPWYTDISMITLSTI